MCANEVRLQKKVNMIIGDLLTMEKQRNAALEDVRLLQQDLESEKVNVVKADEARKRAEQTAADAVLGRNCATEELEREREHVHALWQHVFPSSNDRKSTEEYADEIRARIEAYKKRAEDAEAGLKTERERLEKARDDVTCQMKLAEKQRDEAINLLRVERLQWGAEREELLTRIEQARSEERSLIAQIEGERREWKDQRDQMIAQLKDLSNALRNCENALAKETSDKDLAIKELDALKDRCMESNKRIFELERCVQNSASKGNSNNEDECFVCFGPPSLCKHICDSCALTNSCPYCKQ